MNRPALVIAFGFALLAGCRSDTERRLEEADAAAKDRARRELQQKEEALRKEQEAIRSGQKKTIDRTLRDYRP